MNSIDQRSFGPVGLGQLKLGVVHLGHAFLATSSSYLDSIAPGKLFCRWFAASTTRRATEEPQEGPEPTSDPEEVGRARLRAQPGGATDAARKMRGLSLPASSVAG